jgi:hypothetical protein
MTAMVYGARHWTPRRRLGERVKNILFSIRNFALAAFAIGMLPLSTAPRCTASSKKRGRHQGTQTAHKRHYGTKVIHLQN